MLQILIISPTQSGIGGISQHVRGLTNFLRNKNHDVNTISSENTFTIPIKGLKNPSFMFSASLKTKFMKKNDIVHAHNLPSALPMKNASGKKILTLHGIYSQQLDILYGKTTAKLSSSYEKDALNWADAITVISKEAQEFYTKLGFKVYLVPNAIDIASLPKLEERLYEKQVIFAGRLSKEKGILDVLEMSSKLPQDIHLLILGSGPEEDKMHKATKSRSNIHFLGHTPRERTISLIRGSDMLIQPSLAEAISSTLLEAMSCKTPIIATNVGGNKELLENNISGVIIEPNSPQQILDGIMDLFLNKEKATKIKEEAFRHVQKYDWSIIGKLYLNIYESLLQ